MTLLNTSEKRLIDVPPIFSTVSWLTGQVA
jgi:hypothetical protein